MLILKHLSDECLEAMQRGEGWSTIKENVFPEGLWKLVEEKHRVYLVSKVAVVAATEYEERCI